MVIYVRKRIVIIAINVICLIAFIVCLSASASIQESLRSQQAASAWAGQSGERFAQISIFFPESNEFDEQAIHQLRSDVNDSLRAASLESTPARRLHTDAWSTSTDVSILEPHGTVNVKAIAVGGDFFLFNPLRLRDGSYITPNDIMHDRIVIDEELAWRLFGAIRVSGFEVYINDRPFVIAGVIARETDFASSRAYTYDAGLFMSFEILDEMTEGGVSISSYTIVMPDPITGFAYNSIVDAMTGEAVLIVENSRRFSLENSFSRIGSFGERSMRTEPITLPYWENAARFAEDWVAFLLALSLLFLVFPVICAAIYSVVLVKFLYRLCKNAVINKIKERDKRKYKEYINKLGLKDQIYDVE
ncbi:MAG: ABC transporter permease [Oscillospiraceae bacterium]|nr:ABC transporter permease [Oscillospiraceae bacterium]